MKRLIASALSLLLLIPLFAACGSPYDKPEKYVSLPELSQITVKNSDVQASLDEVIEELLDNLTGEHFYPVETSGETVKKGDKVYVSYTGVAKDPSVTLSDTAKEALTATESDMVSVIPGSDTLPDALEDILIGCQVGDTVSVSLTYTKDDTDITDLIGKEITLTVKVLSLYRLTVTERHAVKLTYTGSLADGSTPLDTILTLLKGGVETTDLLDVEDTFCEVFTSSELAPHVIGKHKYDTFSFTLTLDAARAEKYGYDRDVDITFEATVNEATETPVELTETIVKELTYGDITTVEDYHEYCLDLVKDNLALQAVSEAATFTDDYPDDLYKQFYDENYNEAFYDMVGYDDGYTTEELSGMLTAEMLASIEATARENTLAEIRERFLLEYLFDLLDLSLTKEEYAEALNELYETYLAEYSYMMIYYGIENAEDLEEMLGKDYLEVQFLYQKLPPLLKEKVQFVD